MLEEAMDLGEAIAELRGTRKRNEVALKAKVDPSAWSSYERGRRLPRRETQIKIAAGLGCSLEILHERAWQAHRRRMAREATLRADEVAEPPATYDVSQAADSLRRSVRKHLEIIASHMEELILLQHQAPRR